MTNSNNNKMTPEEILQNSANISNSLYNLRKDGKLNHLTDEQFEGVRKRIIKFYREMAKVILQQGSENGKL